MTPRLKTLHRQVRREFYKNRQSQKWKKMKTKFKKLKRNAVKSFYSQFVSDLKASNPGKWHKMAKQIGAIDQMTGRDIHVEQLDGLTNQQCADKIAQHFAEVSNEYSPLDRNKFPCFLPAEKPPQVEQHKVYEKISKLKNTRSTFNIDIPNKLRREFAVELSTPLTDMMVCLVNRILKLLDSTTFFLIKPYQAQTPVINGHQS